MEKGNVKYKVIKDYPTIDGMLYKNEIVKLDNGDIKSISLQILRLELKILQEKFGL